ncbi:hypothetical protein BGAL_0607g00030 [Botrytis galanthina]|uniref:Uncharacterized protein n=1 Tax=Botrytis galanthina TaxID=278940 RepID=A0A4S8QT21_9HELO|nr:hypothetical protein BGAL_0607g00030 [Botrytis galanthina]
MKECKRQGKDAVKPHPDFQITAAGHTALQYPAMKWRDSAEVDRDGRQEFIDQHPNAYPSPQARERHEYRIREVSADFETAQRRYGIHMRHGSPGPAIPNATSVDATPVSGQGRLTP